VRNAFGLVRGRDLLVRLRSPEGKVWSTWMPQLPRSGDRLQLRDERWVVGDIVWEPLLKGVFQAARMVPVVELHRLSEEPTREMQRARGGAQ
jgi:hypothetical protein